jgi:recombination protein RecT
LAQPAKKPTTTKAAVDEVRDALEAMKVEFARALPKHINADRFTRVLVTAVVQSPALLEAHRMSLYGACMKAAEDGLLPDGKEAALVTFRSKKTGQVMVQYMPMIAGIMKKVRNSGEVSVITTQVVYKNDPFRFWIDDEGEHVTHEPTVFGDRGEPVGAYAQAKLKDGSIYAEVMSAEEIGQVEGISRSESVWKGPFRLEMWRKTPLRRLSKRLPMSTDLERVITADDALYDVDGGKGADAAPKATGRPSRLGKMLEDAPAPEPAADEDEPGNEYREPGSDDDEMGAPI